MTAAGTASLFVASEWAERNGKGFKCGREPFSVPLKRSLDWWEDRDNAVRLSPSAAHWGYTLYGIERVGLASGFKFFGNNDWYRTLSRKVLDTQRQNGAWNNLMDTPYALLFLARGRHPILMNKLRFDGLDDISSDYWANRPNDLAYLSRFVGKQLERPINWQIVPLKKEPTDWLDASILYIASHQRPHFKPYDLDKLRAYVEAGGMIFTNADSDAESGDPLTAMARGGDANEFDRYVTQVVEKVFPQYTLVDLPADHPLRTCHFKLMPNVKLKAISNGVRLLWVHSPKDVALAWQRRDIKRDASTFELGMNLFVYASGKRDFRHRVSLAAIPDPGKPELGIVRVGRLSYPGNSGPEPGAWQRFCRIFQWKTGTGIELATIEMKNLKPAEVTVAHLTGTAAYALTQPEIAAISGFVDAGGVLLIDDAGGSGAFANAIEPAFAAALPHAARLALTPDHPLLAGGEPGMANQVRLKLRLWSTEKGVGPRGGTIQLYRSGKGAVVFCPIDLTTGLLGVNTWGINGYEPVSAEALVRNVVLWAMDGKF